VKNIVDKFNSLVIARGFKGDYYKKINSTIDNGSGCAVVVGNNNSFFVNCPTNRYYTLMSPFFLNESKYQTMIEQLTGGDQIKTDQALVDLIKQTCNNLKESQFKPFRFGKTNLKN
jgi:exosome complex RNA-binding protein Rrp4